MFVTNDAAANYPNGTSASLVRARRAAQAGDVDEAVSNLRVAMAREYLRFQQLDRDPALAPIREHPKFRAVIDEMAARRIERFLRKTDPTQLELLTVARAYAIRGEVVAATEVLERALAVGGPADDAVRRDLEELSKYRRRF